VPQSRSGEGDRATISYFREVDPAGSAREDLPSGWEEPRKVTSILVDAATPKDGYTPEHAVEVARLSRLVGVDLGLSEEELEWLVHRALLHDLGKLSVADAILEKRATLTEEEWVVVKRHPEIGARMIEPLEFLRRALPGGQASPRASRRCRLPRWVRRGGDTPCCAHSRSGGRLRRDASGQALPVPALAAQALRAPEFATRSPPGALARSGTPVRCAGGRGAQAVVGESIGLAN
jgi:hypothetical protein